MRTHSIPYQYKMIPRIFPNTIMSAATGFFLLGTQERVRNSRDQRAISVRATAVLLYLSFMLIESASLLGPRFSDSNDIIADIQRFELWERTISRIQITNLCGSVKLS